MKPNTKLMFWTMGTSFVASLSLGTPNLKVAGFVFNHNFKNAILFAIAAAIMQMIMSRIVMAFAAKYDQIKRLNDLFAVVTAIMMIVLAMNFFKVESDQSLYFPAPPISAGAVLLSGFSYSFISSMRAPSWIAGIATLKCKHWFEPIRKSYNYYMVAIGLGAICSFITYGLAGYYLAFHLLRYHHLLNMITSLLLVLFALKRLLRVFYPNFHLLKKQRAS